MVKVFGFFVFSYDCMVMEYNGYLGMVWFLEAPRSLRSGVGKKK